MNGTTIATVGNLTSDPELRYSQAGKAWVKARIAVTKRAARDSNREDSTSFYDLRIFGAQAEHFAASVGRGHRVVVIGTLDIETWTPENGEPRLSPTIIVDEIGADLRFATTTIEKSRGQTNPPAPVEAQASASVDEEPF